MKLIELKDVIDDESSISLQTKSNSDYPIIYNTWRECKKDIKKVVWDEEVKLCSYAGIQIIFVNC